MTDAITAGLEPLLRKFDAVLGSSYSAVLYGSAARGGHHGGHSDVNVLLVLDDVSPARLRAIGPVLREWGGAGYAAPLLMSRREWARSGDAFPVEITDIKGAHRLLRGVDPVSGVRVAPEDLRGALERDLAAGLMRLRQALALHSGDPAELGNVARSAAAPVVALCRGVLALAGRGVPVAADAVAVETSVVARFDPAPLTAIIAARHEKKWKCPPETFEGFLAAVDAVAQFVDRFPPGDR